MVEAESSRCLWRRNLRVQPVSFCDGFRLNCETPSTSRCPAVDSFHTFKYCSMALCIILQDSSSLVSVYFCDLGIELYTQDLVKFLQHCLFQDIFFKMVGLGVAPALEDVHSFTVSWSGLKDYVCLFTATELEIRSCIALFETTGNLDTCTFLRRL